MTPYPYADHHPLRSPAPRPHHATAPTRRHTPHSTHDAVADPEQQAVCYMAYIPAENEGRLRAGILLATASRMPTSGRMCAYIVYIYVLEEYRRGGVGCALMRALYDKCEHGGSRERRVRGGGLPQTVHQAQPTGPLLSRVRLAHGVWRRPQASTAPRAVRRGLHRRR